MPGLHITQGIFTKFYDMLEEECHKLDLELACTYSDIAPSSFAIYSKKLQELQSGKAKLEKRKQTQHVVEQLVTFMSILNAEPTDVTTYLLQQCQDNKQAIADLVRYEHIIRASSHIPLFIGTQTL